MKKIFIIIISLITIFTFSVGFTREPYSVSASTVADYELDYNLFDKVITDIDSQNAIYGINGTDLVVSTDLVGVSSSYIEFGFYLIPDTDYILTYTSNTMDGSHNIVGVYDLNNNFVAEVRDGNTLYFKTDLNGRGRILFFSYDGLPDRIYVTEYLNISLRFADEKLGAVYVEGFTHGFNESSGDAYNRGYQDGYDNGYDVGFKNGKLSGYDIGYNEGYNIGYDEGVSGSITTHWFTSFLDSVFGILNIEVFPNIKLIYLIFIPIGLGVLALIFKLVRG